MKREKGISHQEFSGISFKRKGDLREIEDYDRGKKRDYKMGSQIFLHRLVEHIPQKIEYNIRNRTLKKAKV